jgi:hypothetical protein
MRGKQALYETLIPSSIEEQGKKSQRNAFLEERDTALAHRYYYYAHICRLRYDDCLDALSREFFLTPNVIIQRLMERTELIRQLVSEDKKPAELKRLYGWYNWESKSRALEVRDKKQETRPAGSRTGTQQEIIWQE